MIKKCKWQKWYQIQISKGVTVSQPEGFDSSVCELWLLSVIGKKKKMYKYRKKSQSVQVPDVCKKPWLQKLETWLKLTVLIYIKQFTKQCVICPEWITSVRDSTTYTDIWLKWVLLKCVFWFIWLSLQCHSDWERHRAILFLQQSALERGKARVSFQAVMPSLTAFQVR